MGVLQLEPAEAVVAEPLGRGRSGVVHRRVDERRRAVARKTFIGDVASNLVHVVFTGAPNPYRWNEDAIQCALLRRQILVPLVDAWFGDTLEVADAWSIGWDEETTAWFLDTRFVDGRPASLHHPFSARRDQELAHLRRDVMGPLQDHLLDAGFVGLVWQAGRGNPVATNNFLLRVVDGTERWSWIDLESGVPAIAALNPIDQIGFYLPHAVRRRRPLFDDVDVPRLRAWLQEHARGLSFGSDELMALHRNVDRLEWHQERWHAQSRLARAVEYRRRQGRVTEEEATWFLEHPIHWYSRELVGAARSVRRRLSEVTAMVGEWIRNARPAAALRSAARFLGSQRYRTELAQRWVGGRINAWDERGQLRAKDAGILRVALADEGVGSLITDFGVHVALKPATKVLQWTVLPALVATGVLSAWAFAFLIVFGGPLGRTTYTLGRTVQALVTSTIVPWVALLVGVLPVVGNAAYPAQIVWTGGTHDGKLAAFILYDTMTRLGERLPIWGGRDTLTEHVANRLVDLVVRDRS